MLVQEMHIEIDLELQKLNSQFNMAIQPEEKDWFLNNEVRKFMKQRLDPLSNRKKIGFQDTTKRLEDLRDLVKTRNVPVLTDSIGRKFIELPSFYFQYIRFDILSFKSCITPQPSITSQTTYEATINLALEDTVPATYTIVMNDGTNDITLFDIADLPTGYLNGTNLTAQRFRLIEAIRIKTREVLTREFNSDFDLYWEGVDNSYDLSKFRIKSTRQINNITVTSDGNVNTNTIDVVTTPSYLRTVTPLVSNARIIDAEFYRDAVNSHLSSSTPKSPIGTIEGNRAYFSEPNSVVFGSADITYVCMPTTISLSLNSNLNMSTSSAKEITGNTVRFIKALIQDNNYEVYAKENILIE